METEPLDVLDERGRPTGVRKPRAQVHREGDWHRALHLWIVRESYVLMQRRARSKDLEPGKLDVSVGGHFAAGETLLEVLREAEEELGVVVRPADLHYLGMARSERFYPHATDRELQEIYLLRRDAPLHSYAPNPSEVEVLYQLPLEGAIALYRLGTPLPAAGVDGYGRRNDALLVEGDLIGGARQETARTLGRIRAWLEAGGSP